MPTTFQILIATVNNEPYVTPQPFYFNCGQLKSLAMQIQRVYNESDCIVSRKVVTFMYGRELMGTQQFQTVDQLYKYMTSMCQCCPTLCDLLINGCFATINGCLVPFKAT